MEPPAPAAPSLICYPWREAPFSAFPSAYETAPIGNSCLTRFIADLQARVYREPVERVRSGAMDKRELPAVSFSGTFSRRIISGLLSHSALVQIDIDEKDNPGTDLSDPTGDLRRSLKEDEHVLAFFRSVSGTGLKIIVQIDLGDLNPSALDPANIQKLRERQRLCVISAGIYFRTFYDLNIDAQCHDVPRLCFVTDDPEAWIFSPENNGRKISSFTPSPIPVTVLGSDGSDGSTPEPPAPGAPSHGAVPPRAHYDSLTDGPLVLDEVRSVLAAIPARPAYPKWLKILSGVFNHPLLSKDIAADLLHEWSPEEHEREYEKKFPQRLKEIGFPSVVQIAIEHGFDNSREQRAGRLVGCLPILTPEPLPDLANSSGGTGASGPGPGEPEPSAPSAQTQAPTPGGDGPPGAELSDLLFPSEIDENNPHALASQDFLEGVLTEGGMSVLYGDSNVGKSFLAMDIAAAIAGNRPWRGTECRVKGGAVLYFLLEGSRASATARLIALKKAGLLKNEDPLALCFTPINLLAKDGIGAALIAQKVLEVQRRGTNVKLIVIDTLSRAMGGGDENSGQDMMGAVNCLDAVRRASKWKIHMMAVHHCGKDEARGARGHSSLKAATDTEIEVVRGEPGGSGHPGDSSWGPGLGPANSDPLGGPGEPGGPGTVPSGGADADSGVGATGADASTSSSPRPDGRAVITAYVTKQRDLEPRAPMPFRLKSMVVGYNPTWDGKSVTSCVCEHLSPSAAVSRAEARSSKKTASTTRRGSGDDSARGCRPSDREYDERTRSLLGMLPQASLVAWRGAAEVVLDMPKRTFYRLIKEKSEAWEIDEGNGQINLVEFPKSGG